MQDHQVIVRVVKKKQRGQTVRLKGSHLWRRNASEPMAHVWTNSREYEKFNTAPLHTQSFHSSYWQPKPDPGATKASPTASALGIPREASGRPFFPANMNCQASARPANSHHWPLDRPTHRPETSEFPKSSCTPQPTATPFDPRVSYFVIAFASSFRPMCNQSARS